MTADSSSSSLVSRSNVILISVITFVSLIIVIHFSGGNLASDGTPQNHQINDQERQTATPSSSESPTKRNTNQQPRRGADHDDAHQQQTAAELKPQQLMNRRPATTTVKFIAPDLLGGSTAILSHAHNVCGVRQQKQPQQQQSATGEKDEQESEASSSFFAKMARSGGNNDNNNNNDNEADHDFCPKFKLHTNDSTDSINVDRRSEWVLRKYKLYADRCAKRDGIMWSKLTLKTHDLLATKVAKLLLSSSVNAQQTNSNFNLLDWGSGCGVGVRFFKNYLSSSSTSNTKFNILGIDLIKEAIEYARKNVLVMKNGNNDQENNIAFCHADGTDLSWIPSNSMHAVTAFGALLHVPKSAMCKTISHLLRIVKKNGIVWGGYIDDAETADMLAACKVDSCGLDEKVEATVVAEKIWFKGIGIPKSNLKRNPRSIIWRKL